MSHDVDPIFHHEAVVPSDVTAQPNGKFRAIFVGVGGDVSVHVNGVSLLYKNLASGVWLSVRGTRVNATGTTAGSLIAGY